VQESTPINNMLYFSSEVKMGTQKKRVGPKKTLVPEFGPRF